MTIVLIGTILAVWLLGGVFLASVIGRIATLRRDDDSFDLASVAFLEDLYALEPARPSGPVNVSAD